MVGLGRSIFPVTMQQILSCSHFIFLVKLSACGLVVVLDQTKLRQGRGAMTVDSTHNLSHRPTLLTDGVTNATREHIARQSLPATNTVRRHHRGHGGPQCSGKILKYFKNNIIQNISLVIVFSIAFIANMF